MQSASQTHKCNICSIVLINSAELSEYQTAVHIDKMFPFQSCDKFLDIKKEFENYMAKVHGNSQYTTTADYNKSIEQTLTEEADADGMECMLLEMANEEEKAHKRTTRPYRKELSAFTIS